MRNQAELDRANADFWDHICGSGLAKGGRTVGMARYDRRYLAIYPWLADTIRRFVAVNDRVLEVGPGYGTVARLAVDAGGIYTAIDIAPKVVAHTLQHTRGHAIVGSVLELDKHFKASSFDKAIAIGSLHHTGNLPLAVKQVHRALKPGGKALIMVYGDGDVEDYHPQTGEPAPWTDIVPPNKLPDLFSDFTTIEVTLKRPHSHTDVYVLATK